MYVCVCVRERERESMCVCVSVCVRVCVHVCVHIVYIYMVCVLMKAANSSCFDKPHVSKSRVWR